MLAIAFHRRPALQTAKQPQMPSRATSLMQTLRCSQPVFSMAVLLAALKSLHQSSGAIVIFGHSGTLPKTISRRWRKTTDTSRALGAKKRPSSFKEN